MEPHRDPMIASMAICLAFFLLGLVNLGHPQVLYFDESWYLPAAAKMLKNLELINREHPPLAKELIALFYWAFGGSWMSARIGSLVFGTIGLYGFQRAHFTVTQSPMSTIVFGILVATNCLYLTTSRAALLDPYMLGFSGVSLAFFARAMVFAEARKRNFALTGLTAGLAFACKWTFAPLAFFLALATVFKFWKRPKALMIYGGLAFLAAACAYFLTFFPFLITDIHRLEFDEVIPLQRHMMFHLGLYFGDHPYQSSWWQWPLGSGQMWLFTGKYFGVDRVIILAQNPVATLLSAAAIIAGLYIFWRRRDITVGAASIAYLVTLGFWALGYKPNLYIYHYNLPSVFALSVVAQIGSRYFKARLQIVFAALVAAHVFAFVYFLPVTTGAELHGRLKDLTSYYGWGENPDADKPKRQTGNGSEYSGWAVRCTNDPSRQECAQPVREIPEPGKRP